MSVQWLRVADGKVEDASEFIEEFEAWLVVKVNDRDQWDRPKAGLMAVIDKWMDLREAHFNAPDD